LFERPDVGERALLVHLKQRIPQQTSDFEEFRELAISAGAKIIESVISRRDLPDPKYLIGKGKLADIAEAISSNDIDIVLFNYTLTPTQERNLEKKLCCRVLDRTGLILDIFAQRAETAEGKLQVELAQLQYLSTRLVRGWTHLERQKGGIGLRGPGETQLEVDKRLIRNKIKVIKQRLEKVRSQRGQSRNLRQKANIPTISLIGYTIALDLKSLRKSYPIALAFLFKSR
jgi:GTP-binding protein HflX